MPRGGDDAAGNARAQRISQDPTVATVIRVTAGILVREGRVLIAQRGANDRMAGFWEFPGGKIEAGETPRACLQRELREELALATEIGASLGTSIHHNGDLTIELMAFRAFVRGGEPLCLIHQDCRWVTPGQLAGYTFTPADQPFVRRLVDGDIALD